MQSLFVNKNDEFIVNFSVGTNEEGNVYCDITEESLKILLAGIGNEEEFVIHNYKATFKKPSFGDSVDLYDSIFSVSGSDNVNVKFNPIAARYNKIKSLIKSWNLKGTDEKPTDDDIKNLHPIIATVIGIQVDMATGGLLQ
jgi:hypothetical protein